MSRLEIEKACPAPEPGPKQRSLLGAWLALLAIVYAELAGLRTVADFDSGWLLATGRWVIQHHSIPSVDVFSYTAHGAPWIYPVFSGVLLYGAYAVGGYALLSWLGALASAGTIAICVRRAPVTAVLAIFAVPLIAFRTQPRAEMFTTVLFAATLAILWHHFSGGEGKLFLLPVFFALWVNLHLGFIAGLALLASYIFLELLEMPFSARRQQALARLRRAWPWLLGATAATFANPWGIGIYRAVWRQQTAMAEHSRMITEWSGVRLNLATMSEAFDWRNPNSGFWWLLMLALIVVIVAIRRNQWGIALLVAGAAFEAVAHIRFQGLFAILIVLLGGSVLQSEIAEWKWRPQRAVLYSATAVLLLFLGVRVTDLVTSRAYLANGEISTFGAGPSWWLPERAAGFIVANNLPGNVFHDYDLGGYLIFRLGEKYPDYIDGRAIPFGGQLLERHSELMQMSPDSPEWLKEADARGINLLSYSTARYAGLSFPLPDLCRSTQWKPIYLDDTAIVAVRNTPANDPLIQKFGLDCGKTKLLETSIFGGNRLRSKAERYNFYANAAAIYYLLSRDQEAWQAYRSAEQIFAGDPNLHLGMGQLLSAEGRGAEAEEEFRKSLQLRPTEVAWYSLAKELARQKRYDEAIVAVKKSADLAVYPAVRYQSLGQLYLFLKRPDEALSAFASAEAAAKRGADRELKAKIFEGQAMAYQAKGELGRAIERQKLAVAETPNDARRQAMMQNLQCALNGNLACPPGQ